MLPSSFLQVPTILQKKWQGPLTVRQSHRSHEHPCPAYLVKAPAGTAALKQKGRMNPKALQKLMSFFAGIPKT